MYRAGKINSFADILLYITRGAIAKAIGLGNDRFREKAANPAKFTDLEIKKMATLFNITADDLKEICHSGGERSGWGWALKKPHR